MKLLYIVASLILLQPLTVFSQVDNIRAKFLQADSVLLISHVLTSGSTDLVTDKSGKDISPNLFIAGTLNRKIIKERKLIKGTELEKLIQILTRPFHDTVSSQGGCFIPHHSIFIFKNETVSYIDICFHCSSIKKSEDLDKLELFDEIRWIALKAFFKSKGFKYKL